MDRRGFLKGLLGVAGAAALPVGALEKLAEHVALPGQVPTHTLSMFVRATVATTINANGILVPVGAKDGWQQVTIPLVVPELKKGETFTISWGSAELNGLQLEEVGPTPYSPTVQSSWTVLGHRES